MKYERIPLGPLETNCYLIYQNYRALIVDPGGNPDKLLARIKELQLEAEAVLLTHAHFDHIGALEEIRTALNVPVYLHEAEADWPADEKLNGSGLFPGIQPLRCKRADQHWQREGKFEVGSFQFELFETPGHSPGSVTYFFQEAAAAFSGDVLFRGGVGRTDLPGGDHETLMASIHGRMLELPDDTVICSGHGPETTIAGEKEVNPFINGFGW